MLVASTMSSVQNISHIFIDNLQVTESKRSSIEILWRATVQSPLNLLGYRVHYQKIASSYIQYGPRLPPTDHSYNVNNLVPDTYYKICLSMLRNDSSPNQKCVTASTQSWDLPVSVGSSIGAVLALAMIVLLILMIRCKSVLRCKRKQHKSNYDTVSPHCNDNVFNFSETHVDDDAEPQTDFQVNDQKPRTIHDQGGTVSSVIPKVLSTDHGHSKHNLKCNCGIHDKYGSNPNGFVQQRDITPKTYTNRYHDHYHDNAIILHVHGNSSPDNETQSSHLSSGSKHNDQVITHSTIESNDLEDTFSDQTDIFLTFPNADSISTSTVEDLEMTDISHKVPSEKHFQTSPDAGNVCK
ncbi:unnamed protein product [Mytilus coruscus]|uniref:Fibronectin type-III domain-containing protein n=1 Tax=Mytilus coruscus TaxID=42192 RepID=A0A6J8DUX1_MYTCO|nr:unnamed protein product [Mytilus coruscus]